MHQSEREHLILGLLANSSLVTFQQLSNVLDASAATIRRDLKRLEARGLVVRLHGGIKRAHQTPAEGSPAELQESLIANRPQKVLIGARAAELVKDGSSIILNGGTTTYAMAMALVHHKVQVLTNSNTIARFLLSQSNNRVFVPGGEIFREQNLILSPFDNDVIRNFHGGTMFLGAYGVGSMGVMENDHLLVQAEHKLMQRAERLILLVESEKFARRASLVLCDLSRLDTVVTDDGLSKADEAMLERAGVRVLKVRRASKAKS